MNTLPTGKAQHFEHILRAYCAGGIPLSSALDGGAGWGLTAKQMLGSLGDDAKVYAFEPFEGNHRFFEGCDERILLIKKALFSRAETQNFFVSSTIPDESTWNGGGMNGYSSGGRLVGDKVSIRSRPVECVRGDDEVPGDVDFIKLDLQGGETEALRGMERLQENVKFMWIEFMGQPELYNYLLEKKYLISPR